MIPKIEILESRLNPVVSSEVTLTHMGPNPVVRFTPAALSTPIEIQPFATGFTGKLTLALGDVSGDGIEDVVVVPESGGGPHVRVIDGNSGAFLPGSLGNFMAFSPTFTGGVFLALADLNGDLIEDFILGAGPGGGPHVRALDGATGSVLFDQMVFSTQFQGGVCVAGGDASGDGLADILLGAGTGGGPHVRIFDPGSGTLIREFFAFAPDFRGGVSLVVGNSFQDEPAFLAVGAGLGGGPHVVGFHLNSGASWFSFMAGNPNSRDGVDLSLDEGLEYPKIVITNASGSWFYSPYLGEFSGIDNSEAVDPTYHFAAKSRWDWLEGTKWYVPIGDMRSYFFNRSGLHIPAWGQTLWQITRADQGNFEGTCEVINSGLQFQPIGFHFYGHVSPNGFVQMRFTPLPTNDISLDTTTIGRGQMRWINGQWAVEMQMVSPGTGGYLMHWAYMLQYRDGFLPPDPAQIPQVGDYRSDEYRWLDGTRWAITYKNTITGETSESVLQVNGFGSGYFWGDATGDANYFFLGSVTPEGRVLFTDFRNNLAMESPIGHMLPPGNASTMVLRSGDGEPVVAKAIRIL